MSAPWFWMSFADPNAPKGSQFLGAVLLQATVGGDPISTSFFLGLNPGGEIMFGEVPHQEMVDAVPADMRNVLLDRDRAQQVSDLMDAAFDSVGQGGDLQ